MGLLLHVFEVCPCIAAYVLWEVSILGVARSLSIKMSLKRCSEHKRKLN